MKNNRIEKPFSKWRRHDVENDLEVLPVTNAATLADWITVSGEIPEKWTEIIDELRLRLAYYYNDWNEIELLYQFIAPFVSSIGFGGRYYACFSERKLKAEIKGYAVEGSADWMVALGTYEPRRPYFFIHEYKRTQQTDSDPLGQLLIEMLAVRTLNEQTRPIYGAYVWGVYWFFVVVEGDTYATTKEYNATDSEELAEIWLILNKTKGIIEAEVARTIAEEKENKL